MKKLLFALILALASPALAVDNTLTCTGANCKVVIGNASATTTAGGKNIINGKLDSGATSTADQGIALWLGANSFLDSNYGVRNNSSTTGGAIRILSRNADGNDLFQFFANNAADPQTGTPAVKIGSATNQGSWFLGVAGQTQTINGELDVSTAPVATGVSVIKSTASTFSIPTGSGQTTTIAFGTDSAGLFVIDNTSAGVAALYFWTGSSIAEVSDPTSNFAVSGTATTVLTMSANGTLQVANFTGGARNYRIIAMRSN